MVTKDPISGQKKPVKVFSASQKYAKPVPSDVLRTFMYEGVKSEERGEGSGGGGLGGGGQHSIDYISTRAPRIGGEVYSGISIKKAARPTIDTGRTYSNSNKSNRGGGKRKGKGKHNNQGGHNNVLAKNMMIQLPKGGGGGGRKMNRNNNLPEILER